jgi:UPF0271 protein
VTDPPTIDLNSDVGEGFGVYRLGDDARILKVVTSANIACGFHAGDPTVMARTVELAAQHGVAIGAHVAYPDLAGFGRRQMEIAPDELSSIVSYQLGALDEICRRAGTRLGYVKPHGALYNRIAVDPEQAAAVVEAVAVHGSQLTLLTLPDSVAMRLAHAAGLPALAEGYADRAYAADGSLVSRTQPGSVIDDEAAVVERAVALATTGEVRAIDGTPVRVWPRSICIHGDTPGAARLSSEIRGGLERAGVRLRAFA